MACTEAKEEKKKHYPLITALVVLFLYTSFSFAQVITTTSSLPAVLFVQLSGYNFFFSSLFSYCLKKKKKKNTRTYAHTRAYHRGAILAD